MCVGCTGWRTHAADGGRDAREISDVRTMMALKNAR
jgi:hypothetical protein